MILYDNNNPEGVSLGSYQPRMKWEWQQLGYQMPEYKEPKNIYGRPAKRGKQIKRKK